MRSIRAMAGAALVIAPACTHAREKLDVDIPEGSLGEAIRELALQTRSSVALADPRMGRIRTGRLAGRMSARGALRRLVRDLPVDVVEIDPSTFRLVRRRGIVRTPRPYRPSPAARTGPPPVLTGPEIIVTAAKSVIRASDYPGSVRIVGRDDLALASSSGTAAIERAVTSLSSTHLGSGKEKLFLRGVGDSSFSGQTQATVGQYFGEARVNFSAPDPDLRLYDVARTEILLGPQGSLYGAGAMGGIIRIEPNRPDTSNTTLEASLSSAVTSHGDPGTELAGVLNYPLLRDEMAVRIVGYHVRNGGYIDNSVRGERDINTSRVSGARGVFAWAFAPGWRAEIGGVLQNIAGRDAAYVERGTHGFDQKASLAQPFTHRFRLGSFTARRDTGRIAVTANLSVSHGRLVDRFDAAGMGDGTVYLSRANASDVIGGEIRLGGGGHQGENWLVGAAFVNSRSHFATALHFDNGLPMARDTRTTTLERTVFGQANRRLGPFLLSLGARLVRWKSRSRSPSRPAGPPGAFEMDDGGWRIVPSASALVRLPADLQLFVRHGASYRSPAASASPGGVVRLSGDRYRALEIGLRLPATNDRRVDGELSLSIGRWHDVQADIMDSTGFLSASNIGDARTLSLDGTFAWQVSDRLRLDGGFTANEAWVERSSPNMIIVPEGRLPNIPDLNARLGVRYSAPSDAALPWRLTSTYRYVGRSRPGIGPLLDGSQGGYAEVDADVMVAWGNAEIFLKGTNLLGGRGNRFALGSIAQLGARNQYVVQVPRTFTLGILIR